MHRGRETDDDDRHQPHVQAAARPLIWFAHGAILSVSRAATVAAASSGDRRTVVPAPATRHSQHDRLTWKCRFEALQTSSHLKAVRNDFFGRMAETGGWPWFHPLSKRWAGAFGHRPSALSGAPRIFSGIMTALPRMLCLFIRYRHLVHRTRGVPVPSDDEAAAETRCFDGWSPMDI